MHYYLTGDCHGNFTKIELFCRFHKTNLSDTMIILGDAGLNYNLNESDQKRKKRLSHLPLTFFCIHGNHEERPANISSYKKRKWHGGTVYYESEFPNILFAKDGELYNLDGKTAIVIGGAYSVDKDYRLQAGYSWFPDEQPSSEIKQYVEERLKQCNWTVNYVFSHTCPLKYEPTDLFLRGIDQSKVDKSTEEWLTRIEKNLHYDTWYFGHFHENRLYANACMLYEEIRELASNDFIQRLGRPKYQYQEEVLFHFSDGSNEFLCQGKIEIINAYGTMGQSKEVSYDILGPDYRNPENEVLYKHIEESMIQGSISS